MPSRPSSTPSPYTTLFRSIRAPRATPRAARAAHEQRRHLDQRLPGHRRIPRAQRRRRAPERGRRDQGRDNQRRPDDRPHGRPLRSEEHTSELQSHSDLVCRLAPPPPPLPTRRSSDLFELHVPRRAQLALRTNNGGISINDFQGIAEFRARNGGVALRNVGGEIKGETTNGGLTIDLTGDH